MPRLLLFSGPRTPGEEWVNLRSFVCERLALERVLDELCPLLESCVHLQVEEAGRPEVLVVTMSRPDGTGEQIGLVANLDVERGRAVRLSGPTWQVRLALGCPRPPAITETLDLAPGALVLLTRPDAAGRGR